MEHVLRKYEGVLKQRGVEATEDLVKYLVGVVKELREEKLKTGSPGRFIDESYRNYHALGISEEEVIQLAIDAKARV